MRISLDEAADWLKTAQQDYTPQDAPRINAALNLALWLIERESLVRRIVAATNLHAEALATQDLIDWEAKNPMPGTSNSNGT